MAGKMTPRQRAAICWPCDRGTEGTHPRYHRRNGSWQSILTFDLFAPPDLDGDGDGDEVTAQAVWHARATTFPPKPLADWTDDEQREVKRVLNRLLKNVGKSRVEVRKGGESPPTSIHFYKHATISEIAQCERSRRDTGGTK